MESFTFERIIVIDNMRVRLLGTSIKSFGNIFLVKEQPNLFPYDPILDFTNDVMVGSNKLKVYFDFYKLSSLASRNECQARLRGCIK